MRLGKDHDPGGIPAGDLVADIDLLLADAAVNWRGNAGPVELQLGAGDGRFISFHRAGGFHHQRLLSVELLAGDEVGLHQLLVTSEIAAGIGKGGLIFRQLTLRLGEGDFKLAGVDLRQQVAGLTC